VNFEHQIESLQNQLSTLQSRIQDDDQEKTSDKNDTQMGEAERKNLQDRIEQAEDRSSTVSRITLK
jgi:peptidoglycan hydrolase CwlO-like protein